MRGHFPDHPQDSAASHSAPSLRALQGRWCRVGRVLRQGPAPRDPPGRICSLFPSLDEAKTTFSCVDVSTKGRKRRWTFILLGVGEASITPCHSRGGETEARSQPSTSQCCSVGEELPESHHPQGADLQQTGNHFQAGHAALASPALPGSGCGAALPPASPPQAVCSLTRLPPAEGMGFSAAGTVPGKRSQGCHRFHACAAEHCKLLPRGQGFPQVTLDVPAGEGSGH